MLAHAWNSLTYDKTLCTNAVRLCRGISCGCAAELLQSCRSDTVFPSYPSLHTV
jgi:hypothetical protein